MQLGIIVAFIYYAQLIFPRSISAEKLNQINISTPINTYLISHGQALLLSPYSRLLLFIRLIVEFGLILLLFEAFIKLLKSKKTANVFIAKNQKTCWIISLYMLLLFSTKFLPFLNTFQLSVNGVIKASWTSTDFNLYYLCGALLFVFLSELFKEGSKLKEEIDLTI
jgi:hypothetical protein